MPLVGRSRLVGADSLVRRIGALQQVPPKMTRGWATETALLLRERLPRRTGATAESVKVGRTSSRQAVVVGSPVVYFIDHGTRQHPIVPVQAQVLRWGEGAPTFRPRAMSPRHRPRPVRARAARDGLTETLKHTSLTTAWNEAA